MSEANGSSSFWERVKKSRLVQVLVAYLAVSWAILQVAEILQEALQLPAWLLPVALILLVVGLVIIAATAWVQSHPVTVERAARDEVPDAWEVEPGEIGKAITRGELPHLTWARALLGGAIAFSLLFGFAGLYVIIKDRGESFSPPEAIASDAGLGVAVLPFNVRGGELEEWREGMVDLVSTNLDGAAGLRAINSRTVLARWDEISGGAARIDEATSLQVARSAGARYALLGSVVGIGPSVRLTADVYDVESGGTLGQARVEGAPDSVLALVDALSIEVMKAIMQSGQGELPSLNLASVTTNSVPALKAYLEGEAMFRRSNFEGAAEAFERAFVADSLFALAYARLGSVYGWKEGIFHPLARQNRERALALVDRLPERQALLVRIDAQRGRPESVELAEEAVRRYPDDPEAWYLLGEVGLHNRDLSVASWEETDRAYARAVELDPNFGPYRIHGVEMAFSVADSALAAERLEEFERVGGDPEHIWRGRIGLALAFGDSATRARTRSALDTVDVDFLWGAVNGLDPDARLWAVEESLLQALERRGELGGGRVRLADVSILHGAFTERLDRLADPRVNHPARLCRLVSDFLLGLPVDDATLDAARAAVDTASASQNYCAAFYDAHRERWDEHAKGVARLEARRDSSLAAGDTSDIRWFSGAVAGARGMAEWRRGRPEAALPMLETAMRDAFVPFQLLGDLHMELDQPREAVRYYRAVWVNPLARLRLARAYEELGEREKAREAYAYFVSAWSDADPELQPMVEEAKAAIQRLLPD